MSKLPLFSGPLKELNPLREELDVLEEKMELQFRQRERRLTLASISDFSKISNPRSTFNDLDIQHQWFSRAEEIVNRFSSSMEKEGITYSKKELFIQVLRELKQEILNDMSLLKDSKN